MADDDFGERTVTLNRGERQFIEKLICEFPFKLKGLAVVKYGRLAESVLRKVLDEVESELKE